MPRPVSDRVRKNYRLKPDVLARAQAILGADTETETIERALRLVVGEEPSPTLTPRHAEPRGIGLGILKHAGSIPALEADAMLRAIEEGCERVDNVDASEW